MENKTYDQKRLYLTNAATNWLQEIFYLCTIVPMGIIGTILNLLSLTIFLKKSLRNIDFFKYLLINTLVNLILAFSFIFFFYFCPHIFFDLALSIYARIFVAFVINDIISFFNFFSTLIEIMINLERAFYFSIRFQRFKNISPFWISFFIFILSLIIYLPNFWSVKMVPTDKIYTIFRVSIPTDFALSHTGQIILSICLFLEVPVVFIVIITTNVFAFISYRKFIKRKEELYQINDNNFETMTERELKKKRETEKMDKIMVIMTLYLSFFSILAIVVQFITAISYYRIISLSSQTLGWFIFASMFLVAFKPFFAIFIYYKNKVFKIELFFFLLIRVL